MSAAREPTAPEDVAGHDVLFTPIDIGPLRVRNRVAITAHTPNFGEHHRVSSRHLEYHRRRAAAGVGLIVTEGLRVHPTSLRRPDTLSVWSDDCIAGLAELTDAVHAEGATLFGQLLHSGREASDDYSRTPSWGPSPIAWAVGAPVPHAMTDEDIEELLVCFAEGARRVVAAGLDGIEVHLGHGHLLQQFLSPLTNVRDDGYGGSPGGRRRLIDEVVAAVRAEVPDSRAIGIRISADEFMDGGLDVTAMAPLAADLVQTHRLHYVNVSHSAYVGGPSLSTQMADMSFGSVPFRHLPAAVRHAVSVPVLMACRVDGLAQASALVAEGTADLVALTRAHIADPELVAKRTGERVVRRCVACVQMCVGRTSLGLPLSCVVNPEVGLEREWAAVGRLVDEVAGNRRTRHRVAVIGAGPAGLEAAVALAPHADVEVFDAGSAPGGRLALAAQLHLRSNWQWLVEDQMAELERAGVTVHWSTPVVDATAVAGFDGVIAAWGAEVAPRRVGSHREMRLLSEVASAAPPAGPVVVFDDTGGWEGLAPVAHLVAGGVAVHYVTPLSTFAPGITMYSKQGLVPRLRDSGRVRVHLAHGIESAAGTEVTLRSTLDESVELVTGVRELFDVGVRRPRPLPAGWTLPTVVVGDAYAPRDAGWAVYSGRIGALRLRVLLSAAAAEQRRTALRALDALPLHGVSVPVSA